MAHRVTLIPGDGSGPELAKAARRVLQGSAPKYRGQNKVNPMALIGTSEVADAIIQTLEELP